MEITIEAEHNSRLTECHENVFALILKHRTLSKLLGKVKHRVLELRMNPKDEKDDFKCGLSNTFQGAIYNYTDDHSYLISGSLDNLRSIKIVKSAYQPLPTHEEFCEAVDVLLRNDENLATAVKRKKARLYKPMPPLAEILSPTGERQRAIGVGIQSVGDTSIRNEILGISISRQEIIHFEGRNHFPSPSGDKGPCGLPPGNETTTKSAAGESAITIKQGGIVMWTLDVVRPAASSGTVGSAVELKNVFFKGKKVLHKAHVPILNVRYDGDKGGCGPYRDWQNEESEFEAIGNDKAPGIRICTQPAKTIFESGNDQEGNFRGAALYVKGNEVFIVTEMEAGWYRYICQWILGMDGSIKPRFAFSAVENYCVCNVHHHHVYWRLDFDIETAGNNKVEEFNDPILIGDSHWHTKKYEIRRLKDESRKRKWRITNTVSGAGYLIEPGENDGVADDFGVGDFWILKYRYNEIDDGVKIIHGTPEQCKAHIDKFITGESVENTDVVVWYGAHFTHDIHEIGEVGHIVGPNITPIQL
jgi:hypothetical protein